MLDALAADFREHKYDLRQSAPDDLQYRGLRPCLRRPRSWGREAQLWASYPLKALDVEELFDAVVQATDARAGLDKIANNQFELIRVRSFKNSSHRWAPTIWRK